MTDARGPGPDETMPLPRATDPAASPAPAPPGAGYPPAPAPPGAGYPPAPAGHVPGPAPAPGRGRIPLLAIVLGGVLVVLVAVGGGFVGGFVVGHAVGSRDGGISMQGPGGMMRGFDESGQPGQLLPRERKGTGMGNVPRGGGRVGPNSQQAPAPVPSPSS